MARLLAALLLVSGVIHVVAPRPFDDIVPTLLPGPPRAWTYLSAAAEFGTGLLLLRPATRRLGGLAASVLFVAVFPANIQMAVDWSDRSALARTVAYARLPLQVPLVALAWQVWRRRPEPDPSSRQAGEPAT